MPRFACWLALVLAVNVACSRRADRKTPLISEKTTMVTAWQVPLDPMTAPPAPDKRLADQIRAGYEIFVDTPHKAARFTGGLMACSNCHLNAGQRNRALPLVAVAGMFPEYNNRSARFISLDDRIVDCFMRSENAPGRGVDDLPTPTSKEVLAVSAYLVWLAKGYPVGENPSWRGHNAIAADKLLPIEKLDRARGEAVFRERCTSCHGQDGQGVQIGDKKPGPLWGPGSWNDGAGAARVYTLAGIIRYTMPYLDPGSLSDEDAQHVAAFLTSQPRPEYPFKDRDYAGGKVPVDAVYYAARPAAAGGR